MKLRKLLKRIIVLMVLLSLIFGGYQYSLAKIFSDTQTVISKKSKGMDVDSIKDAAQQTVNDTLSFANDYAELSAMDLSNLLDNKQALTFSDVGNEIATSLDGKYSAVRGGANEVKNYITGLVSSGEKQNIGPDEISVTFLSLNGDCVILRSGNEVGIIDTGDNGCEDLVLNHLKDVEELEFIILTHPDSDHIGGASEILSKIKTDVVYMPDIKSESETYTELQDEIEDNNILTKNLYAGDVIKLSGATITILSPEKNMEYEDVNDYSMCVKITLGNSSFISTGDASTRIEDNLCKNYSSSFLDSDVMKLGYHGSSTSTDEEFLREVSPTDGVIVSAELGNDYGHPDEQVISRIQAGSYPLYRTDIQGDISFVMNGSCVVFNTSPTENFKSGNILNKKE